MSDPILAIEASEQDNDFDEVIEIAYGLVRHRIATGTDDVVFDGAIYTATSGARGEVGAASIQDNGADLEITLPIDHAFVRRYVQMFVPPQKPIATLRRVYATGDSEIVFVGEITSMSIDDGNTQATFRVPTRSSEAAERQIPVLAVGRACPYVLYSTACGVLRSGSGPTAVAHKVSATVLYVDGRDLRVNLGSTARNGAWAKRGELVVTSGAANTERMTVREQTDLSPGFSSVVSLSLRLPIPGLKIGDTVDVYAGCDQTISGTHGCGPKFNNKDNYGGYPSLPDDNPFWWNR